MIVLYLKHVLRAVSYARVSCAVPHLSTISNPTFLQSQYPSMFLLTRRSAQWWILDHGLDTGHYGQSHETPRDGVNTFGGLRNICLVIQRASGQHGSKRQEWQNLQMLFEMKSVECSSSIIIR